MSSDGLLRDLRLLARAPLLLIAASLTILLAPIHVQAAEPVSDHVIVMLDRAKLLKLPDHVDTIVVGNPSIADVTMIRKNNLVVVTGKGFGETNLIFLDTTGQPLSEALVTVRTTQTMLTVQRGVDRESYSCAPRCEPTVSLGDSTKFMQDTSGQITARNTLVLPK